MENSPRFYRGGQDHKVTTAKNGAKVNSDFKDFITTGPWSEVKTWDIGPRIHTITGYGLSNYTFVEGETGLILIDTGQNIGSGYEILKMKQAFSDKPISAIIYTHHHYTAGSQAIAQVYPSRTIPVYGHPDIDKNLLNLFSYTATGAFRRGNFQFGHWLPEDGADAAYGVPEPEFADPKMQARGHLPVTHPVSDGETIVIDGVKAVFHHVISDTEDSLIIHFPDLDAAVHNTAVMPFMFPIYTLRGDYYRSPPDVLASIDQLRAIKPKYLIGCHGNPVIGRNQAYEFATIHRDALAFVFQQTVQGINRGWGPSEIASRLELPAFFSETPELFTAYVDVEHMVRGIYSGIIGWWANDPADLHPPGDAELGKEIIDGFGGTDNLLDRAQTVMDDGRYNLAARLATYVLDHDPGLPRAKQIKASALRKMAYATPTGIQTRNFMLTETLRLEGEFELDETISLAPAILPLEAIQALPPETFLQSLTHTVDAKKAAALFLKVRIDFTDLKQTFTLHMRGGAAELEKSEPKNPELILKLDKLSWAKIASKRESLKELMDAGTVELSGDPKLIEAFLQIYAEVL